MNYLIAFIIAAVAVGCVLIVKGGNRFDADDYDDIKDQRPMKARHCGFCRHFTNEGFYGDGWCEKYEKPTHCGKECMGNKGNFLIFKK